ncbi:MAG TPA: DUF1028 domain-containing protein [bacterium]
MDRRTTAALTAVLFVANFAFATFSIVAYDPDTKESGVGVASRVFAVGYIVPWAKINVGAIATQALANIDYGVNGLELLASGFTAQAALDSLLKADSGRDDRQVAIIDKDGQVAAYTGKGANAWAGHRTGEYYSVQGNILVSEDVVLSMEKAFLETPGPLARRIMSALKAGDNAGGDKRGRQSAAILVVKEKGGYQGKYDRLVDLHVDDDTAAVSELDRLYNLWESNFVVESYLDNGGAAETEYALMIIDRMTQEKVDNAEVYNSLAWALATRKVMPEKAISLALDANALAPEDTNIMDTVAEAYYSAGDYSNAVKWEQQALKLEPTSEYLKKQLQKYKQAKSGEKTK